MDYHTNKVTNVVEKKIFYRPGDAIEITIYEPYIEMMTLIIPSKSDLSFANSIAKKLSESGIGSLIMKYRKDNRGSYYQKISYVVDASTCVDTIKTEYRKLKILVAISYGDGCWIGMQSLMRRHEFSDFIAINMNPNEDLSFLVPCPTPGMFITQNREDEDKIRTIAKNLSRNDDVSFLKLDRDNEVLDAIVNYIDCTTK